MKHVVNAMKIALSELIALGPGRRQWQRMVHESRGEMAFVAKLPPEEMRELDRVITKALRDAEAAAASKRCDTAHPAGPQHMGCVLKRDHCFEHSNGIHAWSPIPPYRVSSVCAKSMTQGLRVYVCQRPHEHQGVHWDGSREWVNDRGTVGTVYTDASGVPDGGAYIRRMVEAEQHRQRLANAEASQRAESVSFAKKSPFDPQVLRGDVVLIAGVWTEVPSHTHANAWAGQPFIEKVQRDGRIVYARADVLAGEARKDAQKDAERLVRDLTALAPRIKDVCVALAAHGLPGWSLLATVGGDISKVEQSLPWKAD